MPKRIFTVCYRLLWYGFALIVVGAAILVTALRLMLPGIGAYQQEIQGWLGDHMGYAVTIEDIRAEWDGWAPHLFLDGFALYGGPGQALIGRFEQAHISIDLTASLAQQKLIPSQLAVHGLGLDLVRERDGHISISSSNRHNAAPGDAGGALPQWLLQQKHIVLDNARLRFSDARLGQAPILLANARLTLKTAGERIQIDGAAELAQGGRLQINLDASGNLLTPDWQGDIYIKASAVSPAELGPALPLAGGRADLQLWSRWETAGLQDFYAELNYRDFELAYHDHTLPVAEAALGVHGARGPGRGWLLNIETRALQTQNGRWPAGQYQLALENRAGETRYEAYFSYLKLEEILPFLAAAGSADGAIPARVKQALDWGSLTGVLKDTRLSFSAGPAPAAPRQLSGQFLNLNIGSRDKRYRAENLAGAFALDRRKLNIRFKGPQATLAIGPLYEQPLALGNIDSALELDYGQTPELRVSAARADINGLPVKVSGRVRFEQAAPYINMLAQAGPLAIDKLPVFLPQQTGPELKQWLGRALAGGRLNSADVLLRGYLADFPFKNAEGNFKAIFNISDTNLEYDPLWPPIDQTDIELVFANQAVFATLHKGAVFDARIGAIRLSLPDMTAAYKSVAAEGDLAGDSRDLRYFIEQSPLLEEEWLRDIKDRLAGAIALDFKLDIPLNEDLATIDGRAVVSDMAFASDLPEFSLEAIRGELNFSDEQIWATTLNASYHGLPVQLSLPRQSEPGAFEFIMSGRAGPEFIAAELALYFPGRDWLGGIINRHVTGQSRWQFTLDSVKDASGNTNESIEISSDLTGSLITLPAPLGKRQSDRRPLAIQARLPDSGIEKIAIRYADTLFAEILPGAEPAAEIARINIGLGREATAINSDSDISLQGELDYLNLGEWQRIIKLAGTPASGQRQTGRGRDDKDKNIAARLDIKRLEMFNRPFNQVRLELARPGGDWLIGFNGPDIEGAARFSGTPGRGPGRLQADLDRIVLHAGANETAATTPRDLPELAINIAQTIYNGRDLGQAALTTTNTENGVNIDRLSFSKPGFNLTADGRWTFGGGADRSDFSATLEADSISALFETFGYEGASIEGGKTTMTLAANWPDTPMRFALEKMDGRLEMAIGKGQFLDIDPSLGRVFGLLSLQALPRRLTLDFSDLFNEGFAFDNIQGGFSLQQGHAYTNNLRMRGPAADIMISGRTGIVSEDYDQIATVIPRLTNSLPAASALFGPVGIGVGAVIYLTGELFDSVPDSINRILSYQYRITGSWDDPRIEEISEPPATEGLPRL